MKTKMQGMSVSVHACVAVWKSRTSSLVILKGNVDKYQLSSVKTTYRVIFFKRTMHQLTYQHV